MGGWEDELPALAMLFLQCVSAIMALLTRAALVKGMNAWVFIFYRQAIATLVISPVAFFTRVLLNQTFYFEGLYLASSWIASAMSNLVPAVTFLIAVIFRLEKVNLRRLSSIAKILGTTSCVGGTISMALLKGPALVNGQLPPSNSLVVQSLGGDTWFLGCLCLVGAMCCWSLWIILQVPITERCSDHISLSAWMCFLAMLQAGVVAPFFERDPQAWKLSSSLELICCFFPGVFGSGIQFVVLPWCVSRRGPVFSAMFSPLCTVITTVLACIFLHEKIYLGSLLGAMAVIIGLYVVLWGKSEELKAKVFEPDSPVQNIVAEAVQEKTDCEDDLEQQLLMTDHSTNQQ